MIDGVCERCAAECTGFECSDCRDLLDQIQSLKHLATEQTDRAATWRRIASGKTGWERDEAEAIAESCRQLAISYLARVKGCHERLDAREGVTIASQLPLPVAVGLPVAS